MANVYLDLGTHFGQGLEHFIQMLNVDESWRVHTFEANPITYKQFTEDAYKKYPYVIAHNEAVTDYDGTITVNIETVPEGDNGMGTSVIGLDKWNPWGGTLRENFTKTEEVPCVDLSRFIKDNFSENDRIFIKMDIEGSEFAVLQKLVDENLLDRINTLVVEWHAHFYTNQEEMEVKKAELTKKLVDAGVQLLDWH
jgi:FkbM family methyltransferase